MKDRETMGMDAIVNKLLPVDQRPSREEAEDAVRVLLRWAGDDPEREGLIDTGRQWVRVLDSEALRAIDA